MNTKKHNKRKRNRGSKNLFWLVKSTLKGSRQLILYNRKPYRLDISYSKYADEHYDREIWFSVHSESYLGNNVIDKFSDITHETPQPVKLLIDDFDPDMFIQRKKDNLFISSRTMKITKGTGEEVIELSYPTRISNKLFPGITEKDGITGVKIYEEAKEKEI